MGNASSLFDIKMDDLYQLMQSRDVHILQKNFGGVKGLEAKLKTNLLTGLNYNRNDLRARRKAFGSNDIHYKLYDNSILPKESFLMVVRNGELNKIEYQKLVVGDILQVKAGDTIVVDGILVDGSVKINKSTSSSKPELVQCGTNMFPYLLAGSYIQEGHGKLLVLAVGEHTQYNSMQCLCQHHYIFVG